MAGLHAQFVWIFTHKNSAGKYLLFKEVFFLQGQSSFLAVASRLAGDEAGDNVKNGEVYEDNMKDEEVNKDNVEEGELEENMTA